MKALENVNRHTQRKGVITLLYKKIKGERPDLDNWRLISLLNYDYKIQRVSKNGVCRNASFMIYTYSIFSTVFHIIFKITKLALKYRLFRQICNCHS